MGAINTDNYKIEYSGGKVRCITKNSNDTAVILWEHDENSEYSEKSIEYPLLDYNLLVPAPIDINHNVKHYHDLDTVELYTAYAHILKMIERMDKASKDRRLRSDNKWSMNDLRSYCQVWLDDVRYRQDGNNRWWVWDRIKYFLRGKLKQRIWWLQAFGTICYDMCARLDAIDGGNEAQQPEQIAPQQHRIGFN